MSGNILRDSSSGHLMRASGGHLLRALYTPQFYADRRYINYISYTVSGLDGYGTRDDVYPGVLSNLSWAWGWLPIPNEVRAWSEWRYGSGFARMYYRFCALRCNCNTYGFVGRTLKAITKTTPNSTSDWLMPAGGGTPMFSVSTSSVDAINPENSLAWVEGDFRKAVTDPSSSTTTTLYTSLTLDYWLWVCTYIEDVEPPTVAQQYCRVSSTAYTLAF